MMGADGLKAKIERARSSMKVGYDEIFSRFGGRYQRVSPEGKEAKDEFKKLQTGLILKANAPLEKMQAIFAKTDGSLRRLHLEVHKMALVSQLEDKNEKEEKEKLKDMNLEILREAQENFKNAKTPSEKKAYAELIAKYTEKIDLA